MGLTNSVEDINESDIQITNEGKYNSGMILQKIYTRKCAL